MTQKDVVKLFKRFLIVFVFCIPLIIVLTLVAKLKSIFVILITVVTCGGIFCLEEYLRMKRLKKKQEKRKNSE